MDDLVAAFEALRAKGVSEEEAVLVSRDPDELRRLLSAGSLGALHGTAEAMATSGCAECAVNKAYTK